MLIVDLQWNHTLGLYLYWDTEQVQNIKRIYMYYAYCVCSRSHTGVVDIYEKNRVPVKTKVKKVVTYPLQQPDQHYTCYRGS